MIYRCIESYTPDPELKALMKIMATDEVRHYRKFRAMFFQYQTTERKTLFSIGKTILGRSELVKARDIALGFEPLNEFWTIPMPFRALQFEEFVAEAGRLMTRHFPVKTAERMLFKPLSNGGLIEKPMKWVLRKLIIRKYPNFRVGNTATLA